MRAQGVDFTAIVLWDGVIHHSFSHIFSQHGIHKIAAVPLCDGSRCFTVILGLGVPLEQPCAANMTRGAAQGLRTGQRPKFW